MAKRMTETQRKLSRESTLEDTPGMVDQINLELSFDTAIGADQKIVEALFKEYGAEVSQLAELNAHSEKLRSILDDSPELAQDFAKDPVAVVAKLFPEINLPEPASKPIFSDKYRVKLQPAVTAPDGAILALRRAAEYVAASPANETAFVADPLDTLRRANVGQPVPDLARAESALEQVLGIFRIARLPIEEWVYASSRVLTEHRPF